MTKPHGAGRNLVGGLIHTGRGSVPGLTIVKPEDATVTKAKQDGVYTLNGGRFNIHKGDVIPDGAVIEGDDEPEAEERAQKAAPENKAKAGAPETKAKA